MKVFIDPAGLATLPDIGDLPFTEDGTTRTFSADVEPSALHWHWDQEHRTVIAQHQTDWQLQLDNMLPMSLDVETFIPAGMWHRLIKGTGPLTLTVIKHASV